MAAQKDCMCQVDSSYLSLQNLGDHLEDKFYMGTHIVLGLGLCITLAGVLGQWLQQ